MKNLFCTYATTVVQVDYDVNADALFGIYFQHPDTKQYLPYTEENFRQAFLDHARSQQKTPEIK